MPKPVWKNIDDQIGINHMIELPVGLRAQIIGQIGDGRGFLAQKLGGEQLDRGLVKLLRSRDHRCSGCWRHMSVEVLRTDPIVDDSVIVKWSLLLWPSHSLESYLCCQFIWIIGVCEVCNNIVDEASRSGRPLSIPARQGALLFSLHSYSPPDVTTLSVKSV